MSPIISRQARALGSAIDLQIALDDPARAPEAEDALAAALAWLRAAEARLSRFQPTSELCALNAAAGAWFPASPELFAIVQAALAWAKRTGGLFDPTILHALEDAGYDRDFERLRPHPPTPSPSSAHATDGEGEPANHGENADSVGAWPATPASPRDHLTPRADLAPSQSAQADFVARRPLGAHSFARAPHPAAYTRIHLDPRRQRIHVPQGVGIDLGGIGKGWLADALSARVLGAFPNVLVNLGGDLRVRGEPEPGAGWIIGVRDPRAVGQSPPVYLGGVELRSGGIATSGAAWRWWRRADQTTAHHLIDPRTGQPSALVSVTPQPDAALAVTALAETATAADALAKYALLLGRAAGLAMLSNGATQAGLFIMGDGTLTASANLQAYLTAHGARPHP